MPPPQGSYNLEAAMEALIKSGLSANVSLSGTAIVNGTSNPFTGTGSLTLSPGVGGMFNGTMAQLQTQSITGTVTVAGQTSPYSAHRDSYNGRNICHDAGNNESVL
jgi:hypothetical protein